MHAINRGLTDDWDSTRARWLAMADPKARDLVELIDQGKNMELVKDAKPTAGLASARRINGNTKPNVPRKNKKGDKECCGYCHKPGHKESDCWTKNPGLKPKHKRQASEAKEGSHNTAKRRRD